MPILGNHLHDGDYTIFYMEIGGILKKKVLIVAGVLMKELNAFDKVERDTVYSTSLGHVEYWVTKDCLKNNLLLSVGSDFIVSSGELLDEVKNNNDSSLSFLTPMFGGVQMENIIGSPRVCLYDFKSKSNYYST